MFHSEPVPGQTLEAIAQLSVMDEDALLVDAALTGDQRAFEALVRRHERQFLLVARGIVRDEAAAQDVVQEAFLSIYKRLDSFRRGSNFRSWAYRVVVNASLMHLRRGRYRREVAMAQAPVLTSSSGLMGDMLSLRDPLELAQARALLQGAMEALPALYREVFVLREADGMSLQEIGAALSLSVPAVKSRLHRARLIMRASLAPQLDGWR